MVFNSSPESWRIKQLDRVAYFNPHDSLPTSWNDNAEVTFISMANIDEIKGSIKEIEIKKLGEISSSKTKFQKNDIVFAKITPCVENKKVAIVDKIQSEIGFGSTEFYIIRAKENKILTKYIFHFLRTDYVLNRAVLSMTGTTGRKRVPSNFLKSLLIPLPTLNEQERIVETLEMADEIRRKRREAAQLIDKIVRAIFIEMFGNPKINPKKLPEKRLRDIATINMGQSPPSATYNSEGIGLPFMQGKAEFGDIYPTHVKWCSSPRKIAEKGDILMSVRAPVGPVNINPVKCCIGRGLCAIKGRQGIIKQSYLFYYLQLIEEEIAQMGHGSTFKAIKKDEVGGIRVLQPPISLQQEFLKVVLLYGELKQKKIESAKNIETLFQNLLKQAFAGELTHEWRIANKIVWQLPELSERQKALLAVISYQGSLYDKPLSVTVAMKDMFLLQEEKRIELGYGFVPYKYGPFSKEVYEDIERLEDELLITRTKSRRSVERQEITIDDESGDDVKAIITTIPEETRVIIKSLVEEYGSMRFEQLLDYVYNKYPHYAVNSKRKAKDKTFRNILS